MPETTSTLIQRDAACWTLRVGRERPSVAGAILLGETEEDGPVGCVGVTSRMDAKGEFTGDQLGTS